MITIPMDFSTMRKKIETSAYSNLHDFRIDFILMCKNSIVYNEAESEITGFAKYMLRAGNALLEQFRSEIERIDDANSSFDEHSSEGENDADAGPVSKLDFFRAPAKDRRSTVLGVWPNNPRHHALPRISSLAGGSITKITPYAPGEASSDGCIPVTDLHYSPLLAFGPTFDSSEANLDVGSNSTLAYGKQSCWATDYKKVATFSYLEHAANILNISSRMDVSSKELHAQQSALADCLESEHGSHADVATAGGSPNDVSTDGSKDRDANDTNTPQKDDPASMASCADTPTPGVDTPTLNNTAGAKSSHASDKETQLADTLTGADAVSSTTAATPTPSNPTLAARQLETMATKPLSLCSGFVQTGLDANKPARPTPGGDLLQLDDGADKGPTFEARCKEILSNAKLLQRLNNARKHRLDGQEFWQASQDECRNAAMIRESLTRLVSSIPPGKLASEDFIRQAIGVKFVSPATAAGQSNKKRRREHKKRRKRDDDTGSQSETLNFAGILEKQDQKIQKLGSLSNQVVCEHCGEKAPRWSRQNTFLEQPLCHACGLYLLRNGRRRPIVFDADDTGVDAKTLQRKPASDFVWNSGNRHNGQFAQSEMYLRGGGSLYRARHPAAGPTLGQPKPKPKPARPPGSAKANGVWSCDICGKQFGTFQAYGGHIGNAHKDERKRRESLGLD